MSTTTVVTNIASLLDLSALFGDFAADFDVNAIHSQYVLALQDAARPIVPSVIVCHNGDVIADADEADAAREIDWTELADGIDMGSRLEAFDGDQAERTYAVVAFDTYRDERRRYDIAATAPSDATAEAAGRYGKEIGVSSNDVEVIHLGIVR